MLKEPAHTVVHTRWIRAKHWGILFSVGLHSLSYWLRNTAGDAVLQTRESCNSAIWVAIVNTRRHCCISLVIWHTNNDNSSQTTQKWIYGTKCYNDWSMHKVHSYSIKVITIYCKGGYVEVIILKLCCILVGIDFSTQSNICLL